MPELPEVETMCRGIAPIVGRSIQSVTAPACRFRPIKVSPSLAYVRRHLAGETVEEIRRLGKRVVVVTQRYALVVQPKMTGLIVLESPPDMTHIRLKINFNGLPDLRLWVWDRRGLGTIELMPKQELLARVVEGRLGTDALEISFDEFACRLAAAKRPIKVALLDQKLMAGIGNLYASEMLHAAGIHPALSGQEVKRSRLKKLYQAMHEILHEAIAHEGSTLSDGTYRNALNAPGSYQNHHRVYDRHGLLCNRCKREKITRIVQAQRSTFYCSQCQPYSPTPGSPNGRSNHTKEDGGS